MDRRSLLHFALVIGLLSKRTHSTAIPGSQLDQLESCNRCCRGLPGTNGIPGPGGMPGSPGNNGSPGRDGIPGRDGLSGRDSVGLKGDNGSKGERGDVAVGIGEMGPSGPQGPPGERGEPGARGLVGKVGPIGPIGSDGPIGPVGPIGDVGPSGATGETGQNGSKGERGLQGIKGEPRQQRQSAFSVQKTGTQVAAATNEIVTFNEARINIGGDFNLNTDRFVCRIPGVYFFSYSAYVTSANRNPDIDLMKDNVRIARARTEGSNEQVSSATIVSLVEGNRVWLQFSADNEGIEGQNNQCQFSGFLLYGQL